MRHFKYLVLLLVLLALPAIFAQAQVSIGVHIGRDYGYRHAPPICPYGFYPDYPYGCAPYGYWGPEWFDNGVFIGAGPWYHFYYAQPRYYRQYYFVGRFHTEHDRGWHGRHRGHGRDRDRDDDDRD